MFDFDFYNTAINDTYQFADKIKDSIFIEGNKKEISIKGKKDICELLIGENEIEYQSLDDNHKEQFIQNKKIEIASQWTSHGKYSKKFTSSIINSGLQEQNHLSSILYLNEHYKINCIILNELTNNYYQTTVKDYPKITCVYKNNTWFLNNDILQKNIEYSCISDLKEIITFDCDPQIYKPYLKSISNYKIKDLEDICNSLEFNIPLKDKDGKKKLKAILYNEINLKHYKKST